jgi:hypothetical protein
LRGRRFASIRQVVVWQWFEILYCAENFFLGAEVATFARWQSRAERDLLLDMVH